MSNILLTLRLLHTSEDETTSCSSAVSSHNKPWTEKLRESNHSNYLDFLRRSSIVVTNSGTGNHKLLDQDNISSANHEKVTGNFKDKNFYPKFKLGAAFVIDPTLGRFDNRRMFKTFDRVFTGKLLVLIRIVVNC